MSSLLQPRPAHVDGKPVLWFGTEVLEHSIVAIVANEAGRIVIAPLQDVVADVRYVAERSGMTDDALKGPGWVDLEDIPAVPEGVTEQIKRQLDAIDNVKVPGSDITVGELAGKKSLVEGTDYVTDKEGNWYDIESGKELDKKTGKPIE